MTDEDVKKEYVKTIAQMLEVDDVLDKLPSELSTGMKRAVAIGARWRRIQKRSCSMSRRPWWTHHGGAHGRIDPALKKAFQKTSIVVTHDTHLAKRLADMVVFLQEGRVTFFGPGPILRVQPIHSSRISAC